MRWAYWAVLLAAACSSTAQLAPVPLTPQAGVAEWQLPNLGCESYANDDDKKQLTPVVTAATSLARSTEFRVALASLPPLDHGRADGIKTLPSVDVARTLLGLDPQVRRLDVRYALGSSFLRNETAHTNIVAADGGSFGDILIRADTLDRFASSDEASKACALNTVIHEWTHAVPLGQGSTFSLFQDGTHNDPGGSLVSYTVGAVAQCVYLKKKFSSLPMDVCIGRVGTRSFDPNTCTTDWVTALLKSPPARSK